MNTPFEDDLHEKVLTLYAWEEIINFKKKIANKFDRGTDTPRDFVIDFYNEKVETYYRYEEGGLSHEWYWKKAVELFQTNPDCLRGYPLKDNTVSKMQCSFMRHIDEVLHRRKEIEDKAMMQRSIQNLRRDVAVAVSDFKGAYKRLRDLEFNSCSRVMMECHLQDGLYERALPASFRKDFEHRLGGMEKVADADSSTLESLFKAGEAEFSATECNGCGVELGAAQCMSCALSDGDNEPRRPETSEEEEERRKRPRYNV